jgi:hypothetical protein
MSLQFIAAMSLQFNTATYLIKCKTAHLEFETGMVERASSVGFDLKPYIISICLSFRSSASLPPPFRSSLLYRPTHIRHEHRKGKSPFGRSPSPSPSPYHSRSPPVRYFTSHYHTPLRSPYMIIKQPPPTIEYTTTHPQTPPSNTSTITKHNPRSQPPSPTCPT